LHRGRRIHLVQVFTSPSVIPFVRDAPFSRAVPVVFLLLSSNVPPLYSLLPGIEPPLEHSTLRTPRFRLSLPPLVHPRVRAVMEHLFLSPSGDKPDRVPAFFPPLFSPLTQAGFFRSRARAKVEIFFFHRDRSTRSWSLFSRIRPFRLSHILPNDAFFVTKFFPQIMRLAATGPACWIYKTLARLQSMNTPGN